jgi:hypothetical protein
MPTKGNLPILYPTHLNLFRQCPERYHKERIERRKIAREFSPALAKGIAVHQLLNDGVSEYQRQGTLPANLRDRAEAALPRALYPSAFAWEVDVAAIVAEVKYGLSYLDGVAVVLATEATYQFRYQGGADCPPFVLAAKVDLVVHHRDDDGQPSLDVIDFKSGASLKIDPIQELAARIVVKQNAVRFGVEYAAIRTTTIHLGAKVVRSEVLDADECRRRWSDVKGAAAAILTGTDWSPTPSPLCEWCPFFGNGCSIAGGDDDGGDLSTWLDSVADWDRNPPRAKNPNCPEMTYEPAPEADDRALVRKIGSWYVMPASWSR